MTRSRLDSTLEACELRYIEEVVLMNTEDPAVRGNDARAPA